MNEIKLPNGYTLIANYNNQVVLAQSINENTPEPYVTWRVTDTGVHTGCYFRELTHAQLSFAERAFDVKTIIAEAESDTVIQGVFTEDSLMYRDLIIGKANPRNAREKLLHNAGYNPIIAINILSSIEKNHPVAQELFRYYQNHQSGVLSQSMIRRMIRF